MVKTEKLKAVAKTTFLKKITEYIAKYGSVMTNVAKFIGEIDVAKSSCKTSEKYGLHDLKYVRKFYKFYDCEKYQTSYN